MNTSSKMIAMILSGRQPSYDDIANRAFEIYCANGKPEGRDHEHWRRAEEELARRSRVNQLTLAARL